MATVAGAMVGNPEVVSPEIGRLEAGRSVTVVASFGSAVGVTVLRATAPGVCRRWLGTLYWYLPPPVLPGGTGSMAREDTCPSRAALKPQPRLIDRVAGRSGGSVGVDDCDTGNLVADWRTTSFNVF
jgi:hypothetical protein